MYRANHNHWKIVVAYRLSASDAAVSTHARARRTLTLDNGKAFADHQQVAEATGLKVFFADPYCDWQRSTNENTNGLVRQFLPKEADLLRVSGAYVNYVQNLLNDRPRKCLGYLRSLLPKLRGDFGSFP